MNDDQHAVARKCLAGAYDNSMSFPEGIMALMAAGCAGYLVSLGGRRVPYFGRDGETHTEFFPS